MNAPTLVPTQKVTVGAVAGALATVAVAGVQHYTHQPVDPTFASAIGVLAFVAASYITPHSHRDFPGAQATVTKMEMQPQPVPPASPPQP